MPILLLFTSGIIYSCSLFLLASWAFPLWSVVLRLLSAVLISGFIEISQIWIPGRVSDVVDFISNVSGAAIGILIYEKWLYRKS